MEKFINKTTLGNEKAIRRGIRVPEGAVNMAWVKAPKLTPDKNVVIVDTSRIVEENAIKNDLKYRVMYANHLGILEDEYGNQLVEEEYPSVADVFSIDEDWLTTPGSEYKSHHILPYLHTSKFFHVDFPGLTLGTTPYTYHNDLLKIVDENGKEYLDDQGKRRYRIQIVPGLVPSLQNDDILGSRASAVYRVLAYVDTNENENLYLTYNKVEVSFMQRIVNQDINHREILNPQPYFLYKPEETDVIDFANRSRKWYSTKPLTLKQQVLDVPYPDVDGYKVYVPKKAIGDPRIFQLFRWRLACDFVENFALDPTASTATINAGVMTFTGKTMGVPYIFYNLDTTQYNATNVKFRNPVSQSQIVNPPLDDPNYWRVNFDTISDTDLKKFDFLIFSPEGTGKFDLSPYIGKIKYFTETLGRTLLIETHGGQYISGLDFEVSQPVNTSTGAAAAGPGHGTGTNVGGTTIAISANASTHDLFAGDDKLGGWEFSTSSPSALASISPFKNGGYSTNGYTQYFQSTTSTNYTPLLSAVTSTGSTAPVLMHKALPSGGNILISTMGVGQAPNELFSVASGKFVNANTGATKASQYVVSYEGAINGFAVEGVTKLLFNISLLAVKGRTLDSSDETKYSSAWSVHSPWQASWVINGNVLFDHEKDNNDFSFLPKDITNLQPVWQRKLSNKTAKQLIDDNLNEDDKKKIAGAARQYRLEVTNALVTGPVTIGDNSRIYAYTEAYSPPFVVPLELGPHIIREDPVQGEYDAAQYIHKYYPPKPFKVQVQANYDNTANSMITETVTVTALGNADHSYTVVIPGTTTTNTNTAQGELSWKSHGDYPTHYNGGFPEFAMPQPSGLVTWQQVNYYTSNFGKGHECWPHYGVMGRYQQGSSGEIVMFIQEAMNRFLHLQYFSGGALTVDGQYGPATANTVRAFQTTMQARYIDGVVDAETLYLIGAQVVRYLHAGHQFPNDTSYKTLFTKIRTNILLSNASDNTGAVHMKRSWHQDGPSVIWEMYALCFKQPYEITGVSITPHLEGNHTSMMWRSIDVRTVGVANLRTFMTNYDSYSGILKEMPLRPGNGQKTYTAVGPITGDTIIVGVGQDVGSGHGTSRILGVKEIVAHTSMQTTSTTTNPSTVQNVTKNVAFTQQKTVQVTTGHPVTFQFSPPSPSTGSYSNVQWTNVTGDNNRVSVTMTPDGTVKVETNQVQVQSSTNYTKGPEMPSANATGLHYVGNVSRNVGIPETGWITKLHGVKLLSNADGKPYGFPTMPTSVGTNDAQRHYVNLTLANLSSDPSVIVGFYDYVAKEFITNAQGQGEISYVDYMRRGPQNIYVGIISTYEEETTRPIPDNLEAPPMPFKWAMPVYGVCSTNASRIGIEPLPADLGPQDIWYIPIRTGKFNKLYDVRTAQQGPLTGWIGDYQGTKVRAFYQVTEAEKGGWSTIHGRPNIDVVEETPLYIDDSVIQVRQPPILMVKEPTVLQSNADPVNPVFEVFIKDALNLPWRQLDKTEILDYNVSDGTIFLRSPLPTTDINNVRVNYTTNLRYYPFKHFDGDRLNLNPYPGHSREYIGKPIYVYIVPAFVKDNLGRTIDASVTNKTVRFTLDSSIFDQMSPNYDPLAVQLGVVFITSALDIKDVTILDTRRRGGGIKDTVTKEDIARAVKESSSYWDIGHGAGLSYQKGGFVIVRLPEQLKDQFPNRKSIENVIKRNLPAGVQFKLQDLFGNEWS